ncbi:MAG: lipoate--protein ligase [Desulfovibrionaceae bacterium]
MLGLAINSIDPAYNLALEDVLFSQLTPHVPGYFLLWQNAPSIIVGKHQNTHAEINASLVEHYALPVVRRQTGGGAVYHDLGNLNFSFLVPAGQSSLGGVLNFARFLNPIRDVLHTLGVQAELSSRNDLTLAGRKISGSAQLRSKQGILHHGTLLVSLDLAMLGAVLMGAPDKFLSKGIASVRSRVTNIAEHAPMLTMEVLKQALLHGCAEGTALVDARIHAEAQALAARKYASWDWNFGASPQFTHSWRQRFAWGALEVCYTVVHGHITACRLFGDYFSQADVADVEQLCLGVPYQRQALARAWENLDLSLYFSGCEGREVRNFLCAEVG